MAGRIPQSFIDELLHRVDIIDVIDARVPLKKAGKEYKACCPFHSEKTPSFTVSPQKQFYHCFGCGAHGSAIGFVMAHEHLDFVEAVEELASRMNMPVPYESTGSYGKNQSQVKTTEAARKQSKDIYQILQTANDFFRYQLVHHPQSDKAVAYLKNRGIDGQTAKKFDIGFAADSWDNCLKAIGKNAHDVKLLSQAGLIIERQNNEGKQGSVKQIPQKKNHYDRFRNRIIFPIIDTRQRTIAFGGRIIDEGEPKYLNSPETPVYHKGRELYGLHLAGNGIKEQGNVIVVEGYMDVIMLSQHGVENVVATLGTALTVSHVERLFKLTDEIICCFDGDRAGEQAAWRALENVVASIRDKRNIKFLFLPKGEDPDSMIQKEGKDAFLQRLEKALGFSEMLLSRVKSNTSASTDVRLQLAAEVVPYIEKIESGLIKGLLKQELGRYAGTDVLYQLETGTLGTQPGNSRPAFNASRANPAFRGRPAMPANGPNPALANQPATADGNQTGQQNSTRSPYYSHASRAVQLLLQYPEFYQDVEESDIDALLVLSDRTVNLLIDIHRQLRLNQSGRNMNTGMLLERYRDQPFHSLLDKLASQTYLLEDDAQLKKEFVKTIGFLQYLSIDKEISDLVHIENKTGSDEYIREQRKKLYEKRNEIKQKWLS